jgi:hypothetical protein
MAVRRQAEYRVAGDGECGTGVRYPADDPPGDVAVQALSAGAEEDRSFAALADGQIDCPRGARRERDGDDLSALAGDREGPVPAFQPHGPDVSAGGLGDPQAVKGQQRDQSVLGGGAEPGSDQRADLVTIQAGGVRLVIQTRAADVDADLRIMPTFARNTCSLAVSD